MSEQHRSDAERKMCGTIASLTADKARLEMELATTSANLKAIRLQGDSYFERAEQFEKDNVAAKQEIVRLNKWADDFSDVHLKERKTGEAYQQELRDNLNKALTAAAEICRNLPLTLDDRDYPSLEERNLISVVEAGCRGAFSDAILDMKEMGRDAPRIRPSS